eukprot:9307552-Alexandrium_andersonii.AAC.1
MRSSGRRPPTSSKLSSRRGGMAWALRLLQRAFARFARVATAPAERLQGAAVRPHRHAQCAWKQWRP